MAKTRRVSRKERKSRKAAPMERKASRKTQRGGKRAPSEWNLAVMRVYKELKAKKPDVKFGDALKEASKRKKAGKL